MKLQLSSCVVRSYRDSDAECLAKYANDKSVWRNLRDGFPHPYKISDAKSFITYAMNAQPETMFAITVKDEAVGGIGFSLHSDVERISAEIGYWLGAPFWNKGITSEALKSVTQYAIENHNLKRVFAVPYEWNKASFRVLEKAGYIFEGRMRKSAIKDGSIIDQLLYAFVVE